MNKQIEEFNKSIQKYNEKVIKSSDGKFTSLREVIKKERIVVLDIPQFKNIKVKKK